MPEVPLNLVDILTAPYDAYNWVVDLAFEALNLLFTEFGTPIVFLSALIETTVGLGVIFPGVVLMFLGGANAQGGEANLGLVFASAVAGTAIGDTISYVLGRWGGEWMLQTRLGPTLRMGSAVMAGRAKWLIPFYHLHSLTRAVGPFGAGALHLPLRVWMPLDYTGAVVANIVWVGSGYVFGRALLQEDGTLNEHPAVRLGLAGAAFAWFIIMREVFNRRMHDIREAEARLSETGAASE